MSAPESARIERVYDDYQRDPAKRRAWSLENPGNRAILAERSHRLQLLLRRQGLLDPDREPAHILDIGCGRGELLGELQSWGASAAALHGVDLLASRVAEAQAAHPDLDIQTGDATRLAFGDGSLDAVCLFTVMSSILDPSLRRAVVLEVQRVLRPGGCVVWYDLRRDNPRNPNVRGIDPTELSDLFGGFEADLERVTLLPPLARRLGRSTSGLYPVLTQLPWLRTHLLGILTKPSA